MTTGRSTSRSTTSTATTENATIRGGSSEDIDHAEEIEQFAEFLDASVRIPIIGVRVGVDSLIGLIPGIGDLLAGLLSLSIVLRAWRLGVGFNAILAMLVNIAIDTLIGAVPVLGDIFDIGWKANLKNAALVRQALEAKRGTRPAPRTIEK